MAPAPFMIIGVAGLYIKIVKAATGKVRNEALGALIGVLLMFCGFLLNSNFFSLPSFDPIRLLLVPACFIAGTVIFFYSSSIQVTMTDFYTNKHVCIVHKGEIKGKMFICPSCNAYYCLACKEAIEQIDKVCWNCKKPFDQPTRAEVAAVSHPEPSKESTGPVLVGEGQDEAFGKKLGKDPTKGVIAGRALDKSSKKDPGKGVVAGVELDKTSKKKPSPDDY